MTKDEKARVAQVVMRLMKAADMLMGEATGGKPVQDWGLVNDSLCAASKLVEECKADVGAKE